MGSGHSGSQCWHHGRHHPKIQAPDCTLPNVTCDPMDPCRSVVPCCSAAPILYLTYFTSSHVEIPFRALVLGPDDGRAALFHPSDPLRLYPSLNSYHDDPLSQGLGTLVESGATVFSRTVGTHPRHLPIPHTPSSSLPQASLTTTPPNLVLLPAREGHTTTTPNRPA